MTDKPKVYLGDNGAIYERIQDSDFAHQVMSPELVAFIRTLIQEEILKALKEIYLDKPDNPENPT